MAKTSDLRVLVVGIDWPPETFLQRLIEGLAQAGMQVTVAGTPPRDHRGIGRNPHIRWLAAPGWKGRAPARLARLAGQAARAALLGTGDLRRLAQHFPTVHGQREWLAAWDRLLPYAGRRWNVLYFPWNSAAIAHLPLFELGMPAVISCRGAQINVAPYNPARAQIRAELRASFEKAARVHCVSEAICREAMQFGLPPEKAQVIHPAVDPNFFHPAPGPKLAEDRFRIVSTGALIWRKGYEYALLAVRRLVDAGIPVQYEIIGSGPEQQALRYTIQDLELTDQVRLAGKLPPAEVRRRLQHADAFLLSSVSEGIANAALEAMACELPVVTTDCGGMREAVCDGVEGFVTPKRDAAAQAAALAALWRDLPLRARMGAAGRQRIVAEFNQARQIAQFVELFTAL